MSGRRTGVGSASLVLIFAVLCMTVFALLSLSSARRDAAEAETLSQGAAAYYAADCQAMEIAADIKAAAALGSALPQFEDVSLSAGADGTISYQCQIDERRALFVTLSAREDGFEILRWQEAVTGDWQPDEGINVWTGEQING